MARKSKDTEWARRAHALLSAALDAFAEYYSKSDGIHIDESGCEHLVQVRLFDAICRSFQVDGGPKIHCSMETGPADFIGYADIKRKRANGILRKMTRVQSPMRFDIVFYEDCRPKGIIEVKIGRSSGSFLDDLLRCTEISCAINADGPNKIDVVAALFVGRKISDQNWEEHKALVEDGFRRSGSPGSIKWDFKKGSYDDKNDRTERHCMVAGIGSIMLTT
jgi:hypothetical protein